MATKLTVTNEVLATKLDNQNTAIVEIQSTLRSVATTLATVGRIEDKQLTLIDDMRKVDSRHERFDERLATVERDMPGLRELRKWVVGGVVAGVSMMGLSLANIVLNPKQIYVSLPQQTQLSQVPQVPQLPQ